MKDTQEITRYIPLAKLVRIVIAALNENREGCINGEAPFLRLLTTVFVPTAAVKSLEEEMEIEDKYDIQNTHE
jgi:hypothetical protein